MSEFQDVQKHVKSLKSDYGKRDDTIQDLQEIFLMDWDEQSDVEEKITDVMPTLNPDGRDKVLGAVRLLTGANPQFTIPKNLNTDNVLAMAADIERYCDRLWRAAGRITGDPVHYDEILSLLLWGESHILIDKTEDLISAASQVSDAAAMMAEEIAYKTPISFDVVHPAGGYPETGKYGLTAYYREVEMSVRDFYSEFGEGKGKKILKKAKMSDINPDNIFQKLTVKRYWDSKNQYVWFNGARDFGHAEPHGMPIIPVVFTRGEGTDLFDEPHERNQSFLYSMYKSGMWKRSNLALTVMFTLVFALGSLPIIKETQNKDGEGPVMSNVGAARKAIVPAGADMSIMDLRHIVNDNLPEMLGLAERKIEESTIYAQTLGAPLGDNTPFSTVALLHQAGRLPLAATQRKGGWGIAEATKKALRWLKEEPPSGKYDYSHIFGDGVDFTKIPDQYELSAELTLDLPEDLNEKIQQFNALEGKMPSQWRMENILEIEDPKQMMKDLWSEQTDNQKYQEYVTKRMTQEIMKQVMDRMEQQQAAEAETAAAQQQGGPPQQGPPQQGPPQQGLPEKPQPGGGGPEQARVEPENPRQPKPPKGLQ